MPSPAKVKNTEVNKSSSAETTSKEASGPSNGSLDQKQTLEPKEPEKTTTKAIQTELPASNEYDDNQGKGLTTKTDLDIDATKVENGNNAEEQYGECLATWDDVEEKFLILLNSNSDEDFSKVFSSNLENWPFRVEVSITHFGKSDVDQSPTLRVALLPTHEEETEMTLSDIPLIQVQQSTKTEFLFYQFGQPMKFAIKEKVNLSEHTEISVAIIRIPNIESTDGTLDVTTSLRDLKTPEYAQRNYYYLLTSKNGYLVQLRLFFDTDCLHVEVAFMAGPNDKNLPHHFPHIFHATIKNMWEPELSCYSNGVVKNLKDEKSYTLWNVISKNKLYSNNLIYDDQLEMRFRIIALD